LSVRRNHRSGQRINRRFDEEDILQALKLPLVDRLMPKYNNKYLLIGFDKKGSIFVTVNSLASTTKQ